MIEKNSMRPARKDKNELDRQDRLNKHIIAAHFDSDIYKDFKDFASQQVRTTDAMLHEAIAELYKKHQRPIPAAMKAKLKRLGIS